MALEKMSIGNRLSLPSDFKYLDLVLSGSLFKLKKMTVTR